MENVIDINQAKARRTARAIVQLQKVVKVYKLHKFIAKLKKDSKL